MKRLLDRLRRWLIVKLGGYTEQHIHTYKQIEISPRRDTLRVSAKGRVVTDWLGRNRSEVWTRTKRSLADQLADELLRHDAILFSAAPHETDHCVVVRADLEVVSGASQAWEGIATVGSPDGREMEA